MGHHHQRVSSLMTSIMVRRGRKRLVFSGSKFDSDMYMVVRRRSRLTGNQTCHPARGTFLCPRGHLFMPRGQLFLRPRGIFLCPVVNFLCSSSSATLILNLHLIIFTFFFKKKCSKITNLMKMMITNLMN